MKMKIKILSLFVVAAFALSACNAATTLLTSGQPSVNNSPSAQSAPTIVAQAPQVAQQPASATIASGDTALMTAFQGTMEEIYQKVNPSVVFIQVTSTVSSSSNSNPFAPFFNQPSTPQVQQALGSGFVWDKQGYIVTNNHVVAGATSVTVTFWNGQTYDATIVGTDASSDLAVIKVNAPASELNPVTMASSSTVQVGQLAIAIGNPFGLAGTMTQGIVSAIGRSLPAGSSNSQTNGPTYTVPDVIQTDAAINPGNSGGVLLNAQGEVIGVTSQIESSTNSSAGIGFVIPSDIVMKVIPELLKNGKFEYSWLGVEGTDLTPAIDQAMNLNTTQTGALIVSVTPGGPAAKAGLQGGTKSVTINGNPVQIGGDVIVSINGQNISNFDDVVSYLFLNTQVGQTIKMGILRNGKPMDISVTLGVRPSTATASTQPQQSSASGGAYLGIGGITMTSAVANAMNLPSGTQGVLVEQVQNSSPASQAGLQAGSQTVDISGNQITVGGDVIVGIDNQQVTDMNSLSSAIQQYSPGDTVILTIIRNGRTHEVHVTLGQMPTSYAQ